MQIPDCHDPINQEAALQREYDRKSESFPRCDHCGGSLYPHDAYTALGDYLYCETCVRDNTHDVANLAYDIDD